MFKSILPSKRIASSDFTMLTNLHDGNGKENAQPLPQAATQHVTDASTHKLAKPPPGIGKGLANNSSHPFGLSHSRKRTVDAQTLKSETQPIPTTGVEMNLAFDQLLDDLQIPSTLRPKLIGMDSAVKAAMLKSSQTLGPKLQDITPAPLTDLAPSPAHSLRRPRSIDSMTAPVTPGSSEFNPFSRLQTTSQFSSQHAYLIDSAPNTKRSSHHRGSSFDTQRLFSRSQVNLLPNGSTVDFALKGNGAKDKGTLSSKSQSPVKMISVLQATSSLQMDVENIKKLRLLLRNESASWTNEFVTLGGYNALMCRLNEILEVEWREEQHDDKVLHELLRCFKALATSAVGCTALRSASPNPFDKLLTLLYSDKKPGEVATRQLMTELILSLFDLYPSPKSGATLGERLDNIILGEPEEANTVAISVPHPHPSFFSFIRALLLTPAPPSAEAPETPMEPHEFIDALHRPRIYKTYLQELSDVCRDYFWVFCHPNNTIWVLEETDESRVEKPRAPGGMTGGVEFEAMCYFTTHFRLVNAIARSAQDMNRPKEDPLSHWQFHQDLFLSGFERILCIARKASTTYYPTLHLELARYVALVKQAGFELPWTTQRLVGKPPAGVCKNDGSPSASAPSTPRRGTKTPSSTPGKRRVQPSPKMERGTNGRDKPPMLPSPKRFGPMKID